MSETKRGEQWRVDRKAPDTEGRGKERLRSRGCQGESPIQEKTLRLFPL